MFVIHSYNYYSKGAKHLARALRGKRHKAGDILKSTDVVVNWGDGGCQLKQCLNSAEAVSLASNKLRAFRAMSSSGVPTPYFASKKEDVSWKGPTVVRHKLQGHSGEGIELRDTTNNLPDAPLYVQYIKKEQEFRIHVGRKDETATIIAVQRKARDRSVPNGDVNWQVRNHHNGFIFVRQDANPHPAVVSAACDAIRAIGLDFGAVDVIWNGKESKAYVLEINTAPGLEGQTIQDYAAFFSHFAA